MSFHAKARADNGVTTIELIGELDSRSAPQLNEVIAEAVKAPLNRLVFLMPELTYLASAGLRCLVFAHQKLGREVEIVLIGTQPDVAETIKLTGFDHSIVMRDSAES